MKKNILASYTLVIALPNKCVELHKSQNKEKKIEKEKRRHYDEESKWIQKLRDLPQIYEG